MGALTQLEMVSDVLVNRLFYNSSLRWRRQEQAKENQTKVLRLFDTDRVSLTHSPKILKCSKIEFMFTLGFSPLSMYLSIGVQIPPTHKKLFNAKAF